MHPVMIACDVQNKKELYQLLEKFGEHKPCLKIGMELFYFEGPTIIKELKEQGYAIFLDLKLHDIPNTVAKAIGQLAKLNVDYITIHAAGGSAMMKAASDAAKGTNTKLLAVTLLTSLSQAAVTDELHLVGNINDIAVQYAKLAATSGIDGCICSPHEAQAIKEATSDAFIRVCPGIRFATDPLGDQVRVATPTEAFAMGATSLVIGRALTQAENTQERFLSIMEELN